MESVQVEINKDDCLDIALRQLPFVALKKHGKDEFIYSVDGKKGYFLYEVEGKNPDVPVNKYKPTHDVTVILSKLVSINQKKIFVKIKDGEFDLKMSLFPLKVGESPQKTNISREDFIAYQEETLKLVSRLLEANTLRQQKDMSLAMAKLSRDFQRQRQTDLQTVIQNLRQVQYGTQSRLNTQDRVLNKLMRQASMKIQK